MSPAIVRDFAAAQRRRSTSRTEDRDGDAIRDCRVGTKVCRQTEFNPKEALSWLLGKVDEAIAEARPQKKKAFGITSTRAVKLDGMMNLEEAIGFQRSSDVPETAVSRCLTSRRAVAGIPRQRKKKPDSRSP